MSYILGFGGQKGGSGKTILATSAAVYAAQGDAKVIIYDLDHTQQSAVMWAKRRKDEKITPSIEVLATARSEIPSALNGEDISILDLPGFTDAKTASVARFCDLFVLPTGTGYTDLDTGILVAHELTSKGIEKDRLFFAITKATNKHAANEARAYIMEAGYKCLKGFSHYSRAVEMAQNRGLGLTETPNTKLKKEAIDLIEDITHELVQERTIEITQTKDMEIEFIEHTPKQGRKR